MVSIELRLPTGRFHATPWDHHVNEGVVEWPPSPWRLVRALVATWHLKASEEIDEQIVSSLVETLASRVPEYRAPAGATCAHSRHYMPIGQLDKKSGIERTTKVFDTFVHVPPNARLTVSWFDLVLSEDCTRALEILLQRLGYLGRAESWVEARLVQPSDRSDADSGIDGDTEPTDVGGIDIAPLNEDGEVDSDKELFRLLCPLPPQQLAAWRSQAFESELEQRLKAKREKEEKKGKDPQKVNLSKSDKDKIDAMFPRTVLDALQVDTGELHKQGWSGVPGARWVDYVRPSNLLSTTVPRQPRRSAVQPTAARFAVASQVPPRLTNCLSFAEKVRQALLSRSESHPAFSGKDPAGRALSGNRHTFIFPEANGDHGRITHVTLYVPMGLDERARGALDNLRKVWGHGGHDVQLILLGVGKPEDFAGLAVRAGHCPLLVESKTWESRTPFVPTRHAKVNRQGKPRLDESGLQVGCPEHDLRRLLQQAGYPEPTGIESADCTDLGGKGTRWLEFRTIRKSGEGARGANRGFGFRITFDEPVRGPIALGYGAHFGLGQFLPPGQERGTVVP